MNASLQFALGLLLGALVAAAAWRAGALSRSGGAAAAVLGGIVFGFGGVFWAAGLLLFFLSSSLLSRVITRRKAGAGEKYAKGSRRDWAQVLANGGLGGLLAVAHAWLPGADWPWLAFLGAIAAANADTWATELGVFSRRLPRRITTGRPVEPGTSGAVSGLGLLASLGGAALIGSLAPSWIDGLAVALGGLAGSLVDSLLGASAQAIYYCPHHRTETEQHPLHSCGAQTTLLRGARWLGNDLVNFAASLAGAGGALLFRQLLLP